MANVLSDEKRQQVLALGRLKWPLRRIEQATGVRRETASAYLKAAGIAVRPPGSWGRRAAAKAATPVSSRVVVSKPAIEVTTDFGAGKSAPEASSNLHPQEPATQVSSQPNTPKPAKEMTADSGRPTRSPTASACEPYRELIEIALARGRNAMA